MEIFDIETIAFTVLGYELSYIELAGTLFGFLSVILAARASIYTWPTGIINEIAFFILFFQIQLYSDMYLQVCFFGFTIYGWYYWNQPGAERKVSTLSKVWRQKIVVILIFTTIISGFFISKVHLYWPNLFSKPAAYPYWDALTSISSIIATVLLARKIIETWVLWILVDLVSVVLYLLKGIHLVAIEYFVFLIICMAGFNSWRKKL